MIVTFDSKDTSAKKKAKVNIRSASDGTTNPNSFLSPSISASSSQNSTTMGSQIILSNPIHYIDERKDTLDHKRIKRSKTGCLTCKIRKKKCNEQRPICSDCDRLNKECIWIDQDTMSEDKIKELREKVEREESTQKLRKRKPKASHGDSNKRTERQSSVPPVAEPNSFIAELQSHIKEVAAGSNDADPKHIDEEGETKAENHVPLDQTINQISFSQFPSPGFKSPETQQREVPEHNFGSSTIDNNISNSPGLKSPVLNFAPSPSSKDLVSQQADFDYNTVSPSAFMNFLKDLSQYQQSEQSNHGSPSSSKLKLLDESGLEIVKEDEEVSDEKLRALGASLSMTNGNKFSYSQALQSFEYKSLENSLSPNFNQFLHSMNSMLSPGININPSILPELSSTEFELYNYYVDTLSKEISIAPKSQDDSNSYQKVFLPLAHQDKGVLNGILAWACFHLGGDWTAEGTKYVERALNHISDNIQKSRQIKRLFEDSTDRSSTVLKLATLLILCGAEICHGDVKNWSVYLSWGWKVLASNGGILNFNQTREENWLISNFAYHDLLASSNSNRGTYFPSEQYDTIFRDEAGFSRGRLNPLLGVCKKLYKILGDIGSLVFESKKVLHEYYISGSEDGDSNNNPDAKRAAESQADFTNMFSMNNTSISPDPIEEYVSDTDSNISFHTKRSRHLSFIIERANFLESEIDSAKPGAEDLLNLTDDELELQLTIFEAFQITAKLFMRQAVLKINPSSLESQVLVNDLTKCLDITIGTPVQASLVFPVFIAGIHCVTTTDKKIMMKRIESFEESYGASNVKRAKVLIEKVWKINPDGSSVVDWYKILKELDWEVNFA